MRQARWAALALLALAGCGREATIARCQREIARTRDAIAGLAPAEVPVQASERLAAAEFELAGARPALACRAARDAHRALRKDRDVIFPDLQTHPVGMKPTVTVDTDQDDGWTWTFGGGGGGGSSPSPSGSSWSWGSGSDGGGWSSGSSGGGSDGGGWSGGGSSSGGSDGGGW